MSKESFINVGAEGEGEGEVLEEEKKKDLSKLAEKLADIYRTIKSDYAPEVGVADDLENEKTDAIRKSVGSGDLPGLIRALKDNRGISPSNTAVLAETGNFIGGWDLIEEASENKAEKEFLFSEIKKKLGPMLR